MCYILNNINTQKVPVLEYWTRFGKICNQQVKHVSFPTVYTFVRFVAQF